MSNKSAMENIRRLCCFSLMRSDFLLKYYLYYFNDLLKSSILSTQGLISTMKEPSSKVDMVNYLIGFGLLFRNEQLNIHNT